MAQQQHVAYHHPALYPPLAPSADDAVLLARLRAQVDFYFSPQNLAKDTFLSSLLEQHDNAVPLETIASFPKVRQLHAIGRLGMSGVPQSQMPPADFAFLAKALEESLVVTVSNNGKWIHLAKSEGTTTATTTLKDVSPSPPSTLEGGTHATATSSPPSSPSTTASSSGVPTHPLFVKNKEQSTLLLQGLAQETTLQDVMNAVSSLGPTNVTRQNGTNLWHVEFDSNQHAMAALSALQSRTMHGMPIHASLEGSGEKVLQTTPFLPQHHPPHYYPQHSVVMPQGYAVYDPYYNAAVMQQQQQPLYGAYQNTAMYPPPPPICGQPPVYYHQHIPQHVHPHGMPVQFHAPYPMPPPTNFSSPPVAPPQPFEIRRQPQKKARGDYDNRGKPRGSRRGGTFYPSRSEHFNAQDSNEQQQTSKDGAKRKNTRKQHSKKQQGNANILDAEFPALVENENKSVEPNVPTAGYAAALKKQPSIHPTMLSHPPRTSDTRGYTTTTTADDNKHVQTPSGESTAQLEQDLSQLKVSTTMETEQEEFWEEDEAPPEVW